MEIDNFEYKLRILVKYTQEQVNPRAFAMYQPGFITIGYFNKNGHLELIADSKMLNSEAATFKSLYEQVHNKVSERYKSNIASEY